MIHTEKWYREAFTLESKYQLLLWDFLRDPSRISFDPLFLFVKRTSLEYRLLTDLEKSKLKVFPKEVAQQGWELLQACERYSPLLELNVWNPQPSGSAPGGIDLDVYIPGLDATGEITLAKQGWDESWGSWGDLTTWISDDLLSAIENLQNDDLVKQVIGEIEALGAQKIEKSEYADFEGVIFEEVGG